MAKKANEAQADFTPAQVNATLKKVFGHLDELESARGAFMNKARRFREQIAAAIEGATQHGIPTKLMRLQVKIEQTERKLKGYIDELEIEERKLLKRIVKAHGVPSQLSLFGPEAKESKPKKAKRAENVVDLKAAEPISAAAS